MFSSMAFKIAQYPTTSPFLGHPIVFFRNHFRIHCNTTQQQSLNLGHISNDQPIKGGNNSHQDLDIDQRLLSKLRVNDIVNRIKTVPSNERSEFVTGWEQSGEFETISEFNDLLLALLVVGESQLALKLFDEMSSRGLVPDSWTLSICIRCYSKDENFDGAERVLGQMLDNGLQLNYATVAMLVNSMSLSGGVKRALCVLDVVGKVGFKPRVQTYNCLLKGLCYVGRVEEAVEMLAGMKREGSVKPDIYSYTAVMNGLGKVGMTDEAVELLGEALEAGLTPDAVAYNTIFSGYCAEGRAMEGIGVLKMMKERNCVPDYISYRTLLHGLLKWGHSRQALKVYDEMIGIGLRVEDKMVNTLLRGLCWKFCDGETGYFESARRVFSNMKNDGSFIEPSTYDVITQALSNGKRTDEASVSLESMIRLGYSPRMVTFNGVIRALCVEGQVSEAVILLVLLNACGRVPSRTCYELLIHGLNRRGCLFGARSVYCAALKRGIIPSEVPRQ